MPNSVAPYALAMVVCDAAYQDQATGKTTLLGIFSSLTARQFPCIHPQMCVYLALTDGRGKQPIALKLLNMKDESVLQTAETEIDFSDPRAIHEGVVVLGGIEFPQPGEYRLELYCRDEYVMGRRIVVVAPPQGLPQGQEVDP